MRFTTALTAVALIAGFALGTGSASAATAYTSQIVGFSYTPDPLVVTVGDSVSWTNAPSNVAHTATVVPSTTGGFGFDSGLLFGGQTSPAYTLTDVGTFTVICTLHPFMRQQLVVEATEPPVDVPETSVPLLLTLSTGALLGGAVLVGRRRPPAGQQ